MGLTTAYIALGANLGDRRATIERALALLGEDPDIRVVRVSRLIETEPVGGPVGQPPYLNGVAALETRLEPEALLDRLLAVEARCGRVRDVRWGPRTLDLDLLLYGDRVVCTPRLEVPHPRLAERAFVLAPLAEIAPAAVVPACGARPAATVAALLDALCLSRGTPSPYNPPMSEIGRQSLSHRATIRRMEWIEGAAAMKAVARRVRRDGPTIGFCPTMGALHEGHASLVRRARAECDYVVASVFVNPLQFGAGEDFERYPRDPEGDRRILEAAGCDACFTTTPADMYPEGFATYIVQERLTDVLEGAVRPGHFRGVLTVVLKLFHIVQPHRAYFGRKDLQQTVVIGRMIRDLDLGVDMVVCPTVRDADGLALSSRNRYLAPDERREALALKAALDEASRRFRGGERSAAAIADAMRAALSRSPRVEVDYALAVDPRTLAQPGALPDDAIGLIAARVGKTRLIDNDPLGG